MEEKKKKTLMETKLLGQALNAKGKIMQLKGTV